MMEPCPQHRFLSLKHILVFRASQHIFSCWLSRYLFVENVYHVGSEYSVVSVVCSTKTEAEIVMFDSWVVGTVSVVTLTDNDVG